MTEPTITCPNCKTEVKLTESLAAPLIESTRKQFEQQLAQKDSDIALREQAMREKEKQLADAKNKLDEQVAGQKDARPGAGIHRADRLQRLRARACPAARERRFP